MCNCAITRSAAHSSFTFQLDKAQWQVEHWNHGRILRNGLMLGCLCLRNKALILTLSCTSMIAQVQSHAPQSTNNTVIITTHLNQPHLNNFEQSTHNTINQHTIQHATPHTTPHHTPAYSII